MSKLPLNEYDEKHYKTDCFLVPMHFLVEINVFMQGKLVMSFHGVGNLRSFFYFPYLERVGVQNFGKHA